MELLDKFDAVKITVDSRISETDRQFCAAHEAAYEAARTSLQELLYFWEDILETQKDIPTASNNEPVSYLPHRNVLEISTNAIQRHVESLHDTLIENLVHYFNHRYHINAKTYPIMINLIPEEPKCDPEHKEELKRYKENLRTLSLSADQIIEEIFAQFDGRGLGEQALYELKANCHSAAWNTYKKVPRYERKKRIIRFFNSAYKCENWHSSDRWELSNGLQDILRGIAHYETGGFSAIPHEISILLEETYIYSDITEFADCKKITQMRLYKNGRVDIRFTDEFLAKHFEETYLGTMC